MDIRTIEARAQALLDSHTPPSGGQRDAATAAVKACRIARLALNDVACAVADLERVR